jgi:hypothetical protein
MHVPVPIEQNQVHIDLKNAKYLIGQLHERRHNALLFTGPTGVGKSHLAEEVAVAHGDRWFPEEPGSHKALLLLFEQYQNERVLQFDDRDWMLEDTKCLQVFMKALDTKSPRWLSYFVDSDRHTIPPFQVKCGVLLLSNLDFDDERVLSRNGMRALKNRSLLASVTHDPLANYEYCGWLLSKPGGILDSIRVDLPVGHIVRREGVEPVIVTKRNRRWRLSRAEKADVLAHFQRYAAWYPAVSARPLYQYAKMRVATDKQEWLAMMGNQLSAPDKPRWELPPDLYLYRIENA